MAFRLPAGFVVTPQTQYNYNQKEFIFLKFGLEKQLFGHGYLSMIYEKDFINNISNYQFGLRYEFPFAQTSSSVRRDNNTTSFLQSASGSLMYDSNTNYFGIDNRPSVGKGGIVIVPFLDLNCNGRRDKGEPKVFGLNLGINGGRIERNNRDTTIRIFDLEPYTAYNIEFDRNSFENIGWQIKKSTISVAVNPNQFKLIQIPIAVVGEVSGTVYLSENNNKKGLGRIIVYFYHNDSSLVASTLTETDGFFSFLGLVPGSYVTRIDPAQLRRLHMTSSPITLPFNILQNKDGDVVDGLEFMLQSLQSDTSAIPAKGGEQRTVPTEKPQIIEEKVVPPPQVVEENVEQLSPTIKTNVPCVVTYDPKRNGYVLQISSWRKQSQARHAAKRAETMVGLKTFIQDTYVPSIGHRYRVFIGGFKTSEDAMLFCRIYNFD
jgi:hypothetical protein